MTYLQIPAIIRVVDGWCAVFEMTSHCIYFGPSPAICSIDPSMERNAILTCSVSLQSRESNPSHPSEQPKMNRPAMKSLCWNHLESTIIYNPTNFMSSYEFYLIYVIDTPKNLPFMLLHIHIWYVRLIFAQDLQTNLMWMALDDWIAYFHSRSLCRSSSKNSRTP